MLLAPRTAKGLVLDVPRCAAPLGVPANANAPPEFSGVSENRRAERNKFAGRFLSTFHSDEACPDVVLVVLLFRTRLAAGSRCANVARSLSLSWHSWNPKKANR